MAHSSKFTSYTKRKIISRLRKGLSLTTIAEEVGISRRTLYNWLERGQWETEGKYHKFYLACKAAQGMHWEQLQEKLENVIYKGATEPTTTTTTTTTTDAEGNVTEKVVVKETPPSGRFALEVLARRDPNKWNKVVMLKMQQDIRTKLREHGLDPEKVLGKIRTMLAAEIALAAEKTAGSENAAGAEKTADITDAAAAHPPSPELSAPVETEGDVRD